MSEPLVLQGAAPDRNLTKLAAYREVGGYDQLERARGMEPQALLDELLAANVRGRGGAGFPMGKKASFLAKGTGKPTYLVVNADESEPGTFKDREIMFTVPHRLIEGCLITAHAIGAEHVFIYIRGEYLKEFELLRAALEQVRKAKMLEGVTIVLHRGAGAYICGEETALLESLEGERGQPRTKPPFPAVAGLYASPSLINNVETIATVPLIVEMGGAEYAKVGVENSAGTRVFSLSGNVVNGGNFELELGTSLRELIYDIGGGIPDGRELKAVIPGGSSVPVLTADQVDTGLDFDSMAEAGSMLGSGAVIVIDDRACMVQLGLRVAQFYMHESCGKCTPCREGTRWMVQLLKKIEEGDASQGELDLLLNVCDRILGKCLCPLGDAAAMPIASYVDKFRAEFQAHIDHGGCPFGGESSLEGVFAPVDQHTHHPTAEVPGVTAAATELVTLTVDGVEVEVPKGTGLVETAMAAGIEIPVFCYEPRLGPAVGACRMCLVEVEGMPKLQAGCTMTAQDGMVVKTAATSEKAADGQQGTLEFILVNHPLDCPVCDKGGECPLQDLTFRYGPGQTRMTFPKRTFQKPIPISPTISLDRERCILCYRCTRFSSDVSEDGELVAVNRGAQSLITTFGDDPYRSPFSGNVTELCPVGALLPTSYRFQARPWEIQNVPTVCSHCPVGCNVSVTTREGKVKRILSRNHPEVDEGWICDKGRFAFAHLQAEDRIVDPLRRVRRRGMEAVTWDDALDDAERLLRAAEGTIVTALSGTESVEVAYALGRLLRHGLGSHTAVLPEQVDDSLDAFRLPLSAIRDAELVVVVGDDPVVERAPIVDLWIKAAGRHGAEVVTIGPAGSIRRPPGAGADVCRELGEDGNELCARLKASDRVVLVWSGAHGQGGRHVAALAERLGFRDKPQSGVFYLPATPNARGVADAWAAASDEEAEEQGHIGLLIVSGDEAAADPSVRALAEHADAVIAITMFQSLAAGWADLVLPATSFLERDGTTVNLEGRLQRQRRAVIPPCPDELAWIAKLAERFGVELSPHAARVFEELSERIYGGLPFGEVGERAPLRVRSETPAIAPALDAPIPARTSDGHHLNLVRYRPLFSGPAVERTPELQFQRPAAEVELAYDDAQRRSIAPGDEVVVKSNGTSRTLRARVNRKLLEGVVRIADEHAADLHAIVEVTKA